MALFQFVTIQSTELKQIADGKKIVQAVITGENGAAGTAAVYGGHGEASRPVAGTRALRVSLGKLNFVIAAFNSWIEPPTNPGETKLYSTDEDGVEKATHYLDKDGKHTFNNGTNHAAQYEALQTAFNQLKADFNDFINNKFNTHVHGGVSGGSSSTSTATPTGSASAADITPAKVEEIRIP